MSGQQNDLKENIFLSLLACAGFVEVLERNFGRCLTEPANRNIS
jgi:hypothetical protein